MKKKFVDSITNFIIKNKECDDLKIKTIRYGLEVLYLSITKFVVIVSIVIITNTFLEFLMLLIAYLLIRRYSFGLHASKSYLCWLITLPIYIGGSLVVKYIAINKLIAYTIWLIAFVSFLLWAPADTPKRPLIRTTLRKKQKIKTCIICILYLLIIIFMDYSKVITAISIALLVQSITVNPLTYMITKTQFNNYKLYPKKV